MESAGSRAGWRASIIDADYGKEYIKRGAGSSYQAAKPYIPM